MPPDFWQHAFDGVGKPEPLPGIEIIGPDKFKAQVNDALAFLGKCDAPALAFVQGEIASVQPGVPSGIDTRTARVEFGDTEVYGQSNYTHDTAVYWLARGFVHEAEHERQARAGYDIEATGAGQRALEIDAIHAEDAMLHACASFVPKLSQPQVKAILDYVDGILDGTVKCDTCDTPVDQVSW